MVEVDRLLREIYIQHRGQMDLVVFSDHGNSHVQNRLIDLDGFLAQHGFRMEPRLREKSVVIPHSVWWGVACVFRPQNTPKLARLLASAKRRFHRLSGREKIQDLLLSRLSIEGRLGGL
jgi:hypothetical protein